jgi:hypothetical protein
MAAPSKGATGTLRGGMSQTTQLISAVLAGLFLCQTVALAKGGGSYGSYSTGTHGEAAGVQRDSRGHIQRSAKAKDDFKKSHSCPSTGKTSGSCAGYVIDHVVPLKRGGVDAPSNMQWQTTAEAKAKDKWE